MKEINQALDKLVLTLAKSITNTDTLYAAISEKLPGMTVEVFGESLLRLSGQKSIRISGDGKTIKVLAVN